MFDGFYQVFHLPDYLLLTAIDANGIIPKIQPDDLGSNFLSQNAHHHRREVVLRVTAGHNDCIWPKLLDTLDSPIQIRLPAHNVQACFFGE